MTNPLRAGRAVSKMKARGGTRTMTAGERKKAFERKQERMKKAKKTTPAQRAFGGGRRIGTRTGRVEGAAAGLGAGLTVAAIREMTNAAQLKKLQKENLSLAQKAAIREQLLKIAAEEKKTTRTVPRNSQSPKPKLRPQTKAKGGAVKKTKMMRGGMARKKKK